MKFLTELLTGGIVGSLERVALEAITTDKEEAEAKALYVKTLDPNGKMRRDVMRFVCRAYGFYLFMAVPLIFTIAFGLVEKEQAELALEAITSTFLPITGLFTALATASFGVNASNNWKDVKRGLSE